METKLQEINRKVISKSFFIAMPAQIARDLKAKKGESFEWTVIDKNTVQIKRVK